VASKRVGTFRELGRGEPALAMAERGSIHSAERLASDRPQNSDDAASALDDARKELLSWAHRGALEIQGKYWSLPEAAEPIYLDDKEWTPLSSSLWDPKRLTHYTRPIHLDISAQKNSTSEQQIPYVTTVLHLLCNDVKPTLVHHDIVVDWEINSLTFEDGGDPEDFYDPHGYCNLRVRAGEIDQIISPPTQDEAGNIDIGKQNRSTSTSTSKNPSGAPRKYRDDLLIEIIRIADLDGLPEDKSDLERQLREWNDPNRQDHLPSVSTIYNIVREVYKKLRS
jgi:hypothetical protein